MRRGCAVVRRYVHGKMLEVAWWITHDEAGTNYSSFSGLLPLSGCGVCRPCLVAPQTTHRAVRAPASTRSRTQYAGRAEVMETAVAALEWTDTRCKFTSHIRNSCRRPHPISRTYVCLYFALSAWFLCRFVFEMMECFCQQQQFIYFDVASRDPVFRQRVPQLRPT